MKALLPLALLLGASSACPALHGGSAGADPASPHAWSENTGWINALPEDGRGLQSTWTCLSGYLWSPAIGWIYLGDGSPRDGMYYSQQSGDTGVNREVDTGYLFGYAWSENTGWIHFRASDDLADYPSLDEDGDFSGYAWAENIGWVNLGTLRNIPDYDGDGVDNDFDPDKDGDGIANDFEDQYGLNARLALDAPLDQDSDGHSAYQEYLARTDPFDPASVFRITDIHPTGTDQLLINWSCAPSGTYVIVGSNTVDGPYNTLLTEPIYLERDYARAIINPGQTRFFRVERLPEE